MVETEHRALQDSIIIIIMIIRKEFVRCSNVHIIRHASILHTGTLASESSKSLVQFKTAVQKSGSKSRSFMSKPGTTLKEKRPETIWRRNLERNQLVRLLVHFWVRPDSFLINYHHYYRLDWLLPITVYRYGTVNLNRFSRQVCDDLQFYVAKLVAALELLINCIILIFTAINKHSFC